MHLSSASYYLASEIYIGKFLRGIFWLVINGLMLEVAAAFVPGFEIHGFLAAFLGAIVLSVVNMVLRWLVKPAVEGK